MEKDPHGEFGLFYMFQLFQALADLLKKGNATIGKGIEDILTKVGGLRGDIVKDIETVLKDVLGNNGDLLKDLTDILSREASKAIGDVVKTAGGAVVDVRDVAKSVLGDLGSASIGGLNLVTNTLNAGTSAAFNVIGDVVEGVGGTIDSLLDKITEALREAINTMAKGIQNALSGAVQAVTQVVTNIVGSIQNVVTQAVNSLQSMLSSVVDGLRGLVSAAVDRISEVADRVFQAVSDTVANIRDAIVEAFNNITQYIGKQIEAAGQFIERATNAISEIGQSIVAEAEQLYGSISKGIESALEGISSVTEGVVGSLRSSLENLSTLLQQGLEQVGPILEGAMGGALQAAQLNGVKFLADGVQDQIGKLIITPEEDIYKMLSDMGVPKQAIDRIVQIAGRLWNGNGFIKSLFLIFIAILICSAFAQQVSQAAGIKLLQEVQPGFSVALPDASAIQDLQRLGLVSDKDATATYEKSGFSTDHAQLLTKLKQRLPEIGIIQVWYLRGYITAENAKDMFAHLGFNAADQQHLLDMSFYIPPPSDLITMSVREAFTPDIAERFGQFDDFPEAFKTYAAQQGISEEWAKRYWAAHWALPSVEMGFQMLHRGVIKEDDLALLLRAHDVMPFWRDKLTAISYVPLTRVDVRRMHKLGVLDDAGVKRAYLDIGYNDENATRLLEFTKVLNKQSGEPAPENLTELTRSSIVDLYSRGTMTRAAALDLLKAIGIGEDAAVIYLDLADVKKQAETRETRTETIIANAKAGNISYSQAEDQLHALGLQPAEVQNALAKLSLARAASTKLPTHAELNQLLAAELIPDALYIATMLQLGYSALWAERFFELAKKSIKAKK